MPPTAMVEIRAFGVEAALEKSDKLSPSAQSLLDRDDSQKTCRVNVLMDSGLSEEAISNVLDQLRLVGADEVQLRPRMAMVHAVIPVSALKEVAEIDQVDWIDIEKSAPLASVLD